MNYDHLKISNQQAEDILFKVFNIKGKATELPGELDFNFRIKVADSEGYILKISRPDENEDYLDFQQHLLQYVEEHGENLIAPKVINDAKGNAISKIMDDFGKERQVRLLTWVSGRVWSGVNPQLYDLSYSLGEQCGLLTHGLRGFDHPKAHRNFDWDVAQSLWTKAHIDLFNDDEKSIVEYFCLQVARFQLRSVRPHDTARVFARVDRLPLFHLYITVIVDQILHRLIFRLSREYGNEWSMSQ